jgi:hypothetical protein
VSATAWKRPEVSHSVLTPCPSIASARSAIDSWPGFGITTVPPCSSAPKMSMIEVSKAKAEECSVTVCGPKSIQSVSTRSRTTERCVCTTALGVPVVPEVNIT